jgi:fructokinase
MTEFLVIGECVADIVRVPGRPDVPHPGGSPANVAYGLARLERRTALLTQLGEDAAGELIGDHLRKAGVDLLDDGQRGVATPTAVVTLDGDGSASYDFSVGWTLRPVLLPVAPRHVHLGSIGAVCAPGAAAVLAMAERLRPYATVSYDPNVRPALFGEHDDAVARVEECVALADVVKASDEDLAWLYPHASVADVAARWLELGPAAVFVTLGAKGAVAHTRTHAVTGTPVATQVADTVGAGDSFMSAALDALADLGLTGGDARTALGELDEAALARVLRQAGTAAALTVSRPGANPPDRAELAVALA